MTTKKKQPNTSLIDDVFVDKVQAYFLENPKKKKVYITSDGFLFEIKKFASNHGDTLIDKEVKTVSNSLLIEVDPDEEDSEDDTNK